jgi:hypothetical protein
VAKKKGSADMLIPTLIMGLLALVLLYLGWRFTLIRPASTFFFPPIAGLIAQALFGGTRPV